MYKKNVWINNRIAKKKTIDGFYVGNSILRDQ